MTFCLQQETASLSTSQTEHPGFENNEGKLISIIYYYYYYDYYYYYENSDIKSFKYLKTI